VLAVPARGKIIQLVGQVLLGQAGILAKRDECQVQRSSLDGSHDYH
jgi:hypothetical protein